MHRLRATPFNLPAFVHFVFRNEQELYYLFLGMGGVAGAGLTLQGYARDGAFIAGFLAFFGANVGALAAFTVAVVLRQTYRLWVYLHYRMTPRAKVWARVSLRPRWSGLGQTISQSLIRSVMVAGSAASMLARCVLYALASVCIYLMVVAALIGLIVALFKAFAGV